MPSRSGPGSGIRRRPSTSRRWLQPRVPDSQLYRLAPKPRKKPKKLGAIDYWDRARYGLRSWGIWLVLAFAFAIADSGFLEGPRVHVECRMQSILVEGDLHQRLGHNVT